MSNNNFSRRRRGMRFKPKGGLNPAHQKTDREAVEARADVVTEQGGQERLFEKRHLSEIERAENIAAGLPPEGRPEAAAPAEHAHPHPHDHKPEAAPAPPVAEEKFAPVKIPEQPKGLIEAIKDAASNIVRKVQRLIRPEKKIHKEVIINAETLETRVAVTEDGKLEEFNIERTTEERLVGSIFKGKVRNLEDGLKAAFVDIGFEKNAFLHYWDIVPNQFDSGVEIVERENQGRRPQRPK
ncbi:MAG: ribonuclease E/G, partial [Verrucomicrobiota bacterium]